MRPTLTLDPEALRQVMDDLLRVGGCPGDTRAIAAEVFLEAELRGIGLQGIDYMPTLIPHIRQVVPSAWMPTCFPRQCTAHHRDCAGGESRVSPRWYLLPQRGTG